MTKKLSFSEYLLSKQNLREAVEDAPQRTVEYNIRKYCKLPVGETKEDKQQVPLKPNHKILIDWLYDDPQHPTPLNLRFEGTDDFDVDDHTSIWNSERLLKWLTKNAREL